MRITNAQITGLMNNSMNANSAELGKLQQQMATGKRILLPSDDPIASVRVLQLQREEAGTAQYRKNIASVSSNLSDQEVNLKSTSDTMQSARDLLLWASNGANSAKDLASIGGQLSSLEKTLYSYANGRSESGQYLLSGTMSDKPAVTYDSAAGSYSLAGNAKHRQAVVANGVLVDDNVTAQDIYGPNMDMLNNLHQVVKLLQNPALDTSDPAVKTALDGAMASIDSTQDGVLSATTELGGRQNLLTLLDGSHDDVSVVNQKTEGDLSQLDYAKAAIDLNNYQLSIQSTQKTYLKINQLSLFGML